MDISLIFIHVTNMFLQFINILLILFMVIFFFIKKFLILMLSDLSLPLGFYVMYDCPVFSSKLSCFKRRKITPQYE